MISDKNLHFSFEVFRGDGVNISIRHLSTIQIEALRSSIIKLLPEIIDIKGESYDVK